MGHEIAVKTYFTRAQVSISEGGPQITSSLEGMASRSN